MSIRLLFLLALAVALSGCGPLNRLVEKLNPSSSGASPNSASSAPAAKDLNITPRPATAVAQWGDTTLIILDVVWADGRTQPVQLAPAADTPNWLKIELKPALIQPPGKAELLISAVPGEADAGRQLFVLQATARNLSPVTIEIPLTVQRQAGEFVPLQPGFQNLQCRGICGRFSKGSVTFYLLSAEEGEVCDTIKAPKESRKIGFRSFSVSNKGYGYGRTCTVAGIFEPNQSLTFVNLGLHPKMPLGEVMLSLPNVDRCWFSRDNTVVLVGSGSRLQPFDLLSGHSLGESCFASGRLAPIRLDGNELTAGSCKWSIR